MLKWPKLAPTSRPRRAAGLSYWGLNESCALTYVCLLSSSWAAESANAVAALTAAVIAGGCEVRVHVRWASPPTAMLGVRSRLAAAARGAVGLKYPAPAG